MRRACVCLVLLLAAFGGPLQAADPVLLNLAHSDANFMMGIRVSEIASSPVVRAALDEAARSQHEWSALLTKLGGNPLRDIHEVLITAQIDERAADKDPKDTLVLIRGALGAGRFVEMMCAKGCDTEVHGNHEVVRIPSDDGDEPPYFVALDEQYAALGERSAILGLVSRGARQTAPAFGQAMQSWVDRVGSHHIWVAARGPFQAPSKAGAAGSMPAIGAMAKLDGVGLGVTLERDMQLALELHSVTEKDAAQLYQMAQGLLAMSQMSAQQPQAEPSAARFLESLQLNLDGRVLSASLRIPQSELAKQIRTQVAQQRQGGEAPAQPAAVRPAPRRPGGILIHGLESKAVEYPVTER